MYRRAHFIWTPDQQIDETEVFRTLVRDGPKDRRDGLNRWVFFRREFCLGSDPVSAKLSITADSRYLLYVNGARIGRGPPRSAAHVRLYDTYDLGSVLKEGTNVIAALVHVYGRDTAWYEIGQRYPRSIFGDGGLWVEADVVLAGETFTILSDADWKCLTSDAWRADAPVAGWGQGSIEDVDGRRLPEDWTRAGFDDSEWTAAREMVWAGIEYERAMGWGPHEAFPTIKASDLPELLQEVNYPVHLEGIYAVTPDDTKDVDRRIFEETLSPAQAAACENATALLIEGDTTLIRTVGDEDTSILVDFGLIHTGYPFVEFFAEGGEIIELAASEKIAGDYQEPRPDLPRIERRTHLDCAQIFRYRARPGLQLYEKFDWTAVRYLQLTVRNAPKGISVRRLGSVRTAYPAGEAGRFACSDPFFNELWRIGRYTALQCTHDAWCDGPGREKRQWVGDGLVHYLVNVAAFGCGTNAVDRQFLRAAADAQRPDGLLQMFAPGDHHRDGVAIADFPLHWICAAEQYLQYTGDIDFVATLFPAVQKALQWYEPHRDGDGLVVNPPLWRFIEWAALDRSGVSAAMNGLYLLALQAAGRIAESLEYGHARSTYAREAKRVTSALQNRMWDPSRQLYADASDPATGRLSKRYSQQTNALMVLAGVAPEALQNGILSRITQPEHTRVSPLPPVVTGDADFDEDRHIVRANTYFAHFLYDALMKAGRCQQALQFMRDNLGPMLSAGAETLWESYDPSASLCHAFSASPVYHLSSGVLGVRPISPGFRTFSVCPLVGDLDWAEGTFPTPSGGIDVSWKLDGDQLDISIASPEVLTGTLEAPEGWILETGGGAFRQASQARLIRRR